MSIRNNPLSNKPAPTEFVNSPKVKMPPLFTFIYDSFKSGMVIFSQMMAVVAAILIPCGTLIAFLEGYYWWGLLGLVICIIGVGALRNVDR